jgi:hypothetical protein
MHTSYVNSESGASEPHPRQLVDRPADREVDRSAIDRVDRDHVIARFRHPAAPNVAQEPAALGDGVVLCRRQ